MTEPIHRDREIHRDRPDFEAIKSRLDVWSTRGEKDLIGTPKAIYDDLKQGFTSTALTTVLFAFDKALDDIRALLREVELLESRVVADDDTRKKVDEAHQYAQMYLMPSAWGRNVWHAILADAIDLRRRLDLIGNLAANK